MAGKLFLLPNVLDEQLSHEAFLPVSVFKAVSQLQGLIVESEKSGRRYLRRFLSHEQMASLPLRLLNEHTSAQEMEALLIPLLQGETWGLVTDAGLPCIADPGSDLVWRARLEGSVEVEAIAGPCSVILALQLSGFSGQRFCFHGYLPREEEDLQKRLHELEQQAVGETQIWMEAPYRSARMLEALKRILQPATRLCVAANLTTPRQKITSAPVQKWRAQSFDIGKEPAVFLIYRAAEIHKAYTVHGSK